jgi:RCC1-like G exchanging factor-like protein
VLKLLLVCRLFVTESGKVYACGWGADGQTGLGTFENRGPPAAVKGDITSEKIVKVASTVDCVLALNGKCISKNKTTCDIP